jgi:hypothetical protein
MPPPALCALTPDVMAPYISGVVWRSSIRHMVLRDVFVLTLHPLSEGGAYIKPKARPCLSAAAAAVAWFWSALAHMGLPHALLPTLCCIALTPLYHMLDAWLAIAPG